MREPMEACENGSVSPIIPKKFVIGCLQVGCIINPASEDALATAMVALLYLTPSSRSVSQRVTAGCGDSISLSNQHGD